MPSPKTTTSGIRDHIESLFPELALISDHQMRQGVITVWETLFHTCSYDRIEDAPFIAPMPQISLVDHTRCTTLGALRLAEVIKSLHGVEVRQDILVAAGLLHDASKLVEYEPDGSGGHRKSALGGAVPHAMIAAEEARRAGLPLDVVNIVVMHPFHPPHIHLRPKCIEHLLVHYGDLAGADVLMWLDGMESHLELKRFFQMAG